MIYNEKINELLKPGFFTENGRLEVYMDVEYLLMITEDEEKELAKKIDDLNISRISIVCFYPKNENMDYTPTLFKYLNKDKIKSLHSHIKIDHDVLYAFNNLEKLGLNLTNNDNLLLDKFKNLNALTITGYDENINFNQLSEKTEFLSFWKFKNKIFDYKMYLKYVETLLITQYKSVNLNKIATDNLKKLSIYGSKEILIDENHPLLSTIEHLELDHCNINFFSSGVLKRMKNLKELWLFKCDLSNFNEDVFKELNKLKVMVLDDCTNLKTIKGLGNLDRAVLYSTKVLDNDTSPLLHSKDVFITNCKTYNFRNKDLPKKK